MAGRQAVFSVSVGGNDVTARFDPYVMSISVSRSAGRSSDTATIELDDKDGQIFLPSKGDAITIGLGWTTAVVIFEGTIDKPMSKGSRGGGRTISISAKSADVVKSKLKQKRHKHKDNASLSDVANQWGKDAGLDSVSVHPDLASIMRPYWGMMGESFMAWGARIARQHAATFKVSGSRAVFAPRSGGTSASGQALATVNATWGVNLIDWSIEPIIGKPEHSKFRTRHYDTKAAEWKSGDEDADYDTDATAEHVSRYTESDDDGAQSKSKTNKAESDRERGSGTITIDGEPAAQPEADVTLTGARAGVDGTYRIDSTEDTYTRGGGYTTTLTVKQPDGGAGTDSRSAAPNTTDDPSGSQGSVYQSPPATTTGFGHA